MPDTRVDLRRLEAALRASWDERTSYRAVVRPGNPAYGQCYPTCRVVQCFYPEMEIACGEVWTGAETERHFWNVGVPGAAHRWIDLSWSQFPAGSTVQDYRILDRRSLGDSPPTVERCALLLRRVLAHLAAEGLGRERRGGAGRRHDGGKRSLPEERGCEPVGPWETAELRAC